MLTFLFVIQTITAVLLVGVILMQQSEGGGLGMGGSPTGLMSARGAADFLTRATTILATLFVVLSILHAVLATQTVARGSNIDTSLARTPPPVAPPSQQSGVPLAGQPTAPAPVPLANAPAPSSAPTSTQTVVPMATAKPRVEPRVEHTLRPATHTDAPRTAAAPPPVTSTVTPSIPKATPSTAPVTVPQGPPGNSN